MLSEWPEFLNTAGLLFMAGRLHPVLVHFPIALIIVAALAELISSFGSSRRIRASNQPGQFAYVCLSIGFAGTVLAAVSGWLNADTQEFLGDASSVLWLHRLLGVQLVIVTAGCWLFALRARLGHGVANLIFYRMLLLFSFGLTAGAGHFGGTLVHGPDYLSLAPDSPGKVTIRASIKPEVIAALPAPATQKIDFDQDIHPILHASCGKCHLQGKNKGALRLDSREEALRGGKSGPSLVPGDSAQSLLIHLVSGLDAERAMPEKGRRLTGSEIALLRAWIDQGAAWGENSEPVYARLDKPSLALNPPQLGMDLGGQHPIDAIVNRYFSRYSIPWPEKIADQVFYRRVSLDLIGIHPSSEEISAFIGNQDPQKRRKLISALLDRDFDYAMHWLSFFNDLLRNDYTGTGYIDGGRKEITAWLFTALMENFPYQRIVADLVNPNPHSEGFVKGIVWRGVVNPNEVPEMQAAQNIAQSFMGINLKCASCHDSFTDHWTLNDAYGLANVYAASPLEVHRCEQPTGVKTTARFIYPELGAIDPNLPRAARMKQLAGLITDDRNGLLYRTIANRLWAKLMGRGIIEPQDEMAESAWSPELLDMLAFELQQCGGDIKRFLRFIAASEIYQSRSLGDSPSAEPSAHGSSTRQATADGFTFRGPIQKRLSAEQVEDALRSILEVPDGGSRGEWVRFVSLLHKYNFPGRYAARFASDQINHKHPVQSVDIDISGAKYIWLIVLPDGIKEDPRRPSKVPLIWAKPNLLSGAAAISLLDKRVIPIEVASQSSPAARANLMLAGANVAEGLSVQPPAVLGYDISGLKASRFTAEIGLQALDEEYKHPRPFRFFVLTDIGLPAALQERSAFSAALGRLTRDIVVASRPLSLSSLDAVELSNGAELHQLLRRAAGQMSKQRLTVRQLVEDTWRKFLLREPGAEELKSSMEFLGDRPDNARIEDFLWGVALLPEFHIIS